MVLKRTQNKIKFNDFQCFFAVTCGPLHRRDDIVFGRSKCQKCILRKKGIIFCLPKYFLDWFWKNMKNFENENFLKVDFFLKLLYISFMLPYPPYQNIKEIHWNPLKFQNFRLSTFFIFKILQLFFQIWS